MSKEIKKIGKHRGSEGFPQKEILEAEIKEKYQYPQIQVSSMQKDQLIYMLSMGFEHDAITWIMDENCSSFDLDFIRIVYFITRDLDFIRSKIINARTIIFEDILDSALELAIEKRHPEYRDITEKSVALKHQEEMLKLRADFMDTQNSYLLKEIKARQEEKKLRSEITDMKLESFDEERRKLEEKISGLNTVIEELRQSLKDSETKRKESESDLEKIKKQLEKAEQEKQSAITDEKTDADDAPEKAAGEGIGNSGETGQLADPGILKEILERIESARNDIRNEIGAAKADILSGYQKEKQKAEPVEEKESIGEDLHQIKGKLAEIASGLKNLCASLERRDSILNKANGGLSSIHSNIDLLAANSDQIYSSLRRIERTIKDVRAAQSENKRKSGLFSFFSESDKEEELSQPEEGTAEEIAPIRNAERGYSYEQMVLKLISNPNLTQEQYKLLLYCIEQKLPEQDFNKIANILDKPGYSKIDTIRLETAIKFYFAQNNMIYGYAKETENQSVNTDESWKESEKNDQPEEKIPGPEVEGQVHNATPVSASMVFDAVEDDNTDE